MANHSRPPWMIWQWMTQRRWRLASMQRSTSRLKWTSTLYAMSDRPRSRFPTKPIFTASHWHKALHNRHVWLGELSRLTRMMRIAIDNHGCHLILCQNQNSCLPIQNSHNFMNGSIINQICRMRRGPSSARWMQRNAVWRQKSTSRSSCQRDKNCALDVTDITRYTSWIGRQERSQL